MVSFNAFNLLSRNMTFIFSFIFFAISFITYAADINVTADRNHIELNETFTLIFETNESTDDSPDFSPLEKDFQVLGTSSSSNFSLINGNYTRSKKWNISLSARSAGTFTIPQIKFGNDFSPSYKVTINQPKQSTGNSGEKFISELEVSTDNAYPQSQIIVTQRLLSSRNINAYEFSPLTSSGINITSEILGEIKQYQTKRGDTPYLVLEQRHIIYPQSSGTMQINPSIATARIAIQGNTRNRSAFDPFRNNTKTIRKSSNKKSITVKPIPQKFKGKHWLVAKEVQLVEEFPESDSFKVGEPITRTLLLIADGQNSSQLPEIITIEVDGLKQYPDKPLLKDNASEEGITGIQQIKVALIPSAAGSYTLPSISVPWWNSNTNTVEYAKIEERTFTVKSSQATNNQDALSPPSNIVEKSKETPSISNLKQGSSTSEEITENNLAWKISTLLLGMALLISLYFLWKSKSSINLNTKPLKSDTSSINQALAKIKISCNNSNPQEVKNSILIWAKSLFINESINSLGELIPKVDGDLSNKLTLLNTYLYQNKNNSKWNCENLFNLCSKFTESHNKKSKDKPTNKLESLYK